MIIKAIWGWFPYKNHDSSEGEQWGRVAFFWWNLIWCLQKIAKVLSFTPVLSMVSRLSPVITVVWQGAGPQLCLLRFTPLARIIYCICICTSSIHATLHQVNWASIVAHGGPNPGAMKSQSGGLHLKILRCQPIILKGQGAVPLPSGNSTVCY